MADADDSQVPKLILIVEDHPDLQRILREVLEYEGYQTLTAASGREALEIVEQRAVSLGLVVSDIVMDDIDGCELLRLLRSDPRWQDIPFVFVSGKGQVEATCIDLTVQADGYVAKPFALPDLLQTVAACLRA